MTVRNAAGGIVQFVYGDDGMDPVTMEGKGASALDFDKVLGKVCVLACMCPCGSYRFKGHGGQGRECAGL